MLLGTGKGSFCEPSIHPVGERPLDVAMARFDGDGSLDMVVLDRDRNDVTLLLGK